MSVWHFVILIVQPFWVLKHLAPPICLSCYIFEYPKTTLILWGKCDLSFGGNLAARSHEGRVGRTVISYKKSFSASFMLSSSSFSTGFLLVPFLSLHQWLVRAVSLKVQLYLIYQLELELHLLFRCWIP